LGGVAGERYPYHPNYLRRLWEDDKFPKPFKISPHRLAWWEHEVDAWLEEKAGTTVPDAAVVPPASATIQSQLAALDPDQVQAAELTAAERATLAAILRKVLGGSSVGADGSPSAASRPNRNRGARR